jgi:hypothetical protein
MRILFDHGAPRGLAKLLEGHFVTPVKDMGWDQLSNGNLLKVAQEAAFDLLLTTDQNIRYQQNITNRKIALVVLTGSSKWSRVQRHGKRIAESVDAANPGSYVEVYIPFD